VKIKDEKPISWPEARSILAARSKQKELGYEQKKSLDHLNKFAKMTKKDLKTLIDGLSKIEKLNERHIVVLASVLPKTKDELNMIFANEHTILSDSDKDAILKLTKPLSP